MEKITADFVERVFKERIGLEEKATLIDDLELYLHRFHIASQDQKAAQLRRSPGAPTSFFTTPRSSLIVHTTCAIKET